MYAKKPMDFSLKDCHRLCTLSEKGCVFLLSCVMIVNRRGGPISASDELCWAALLCVWSADRPAPGRAQSPSQAPALALAPAVTLRHQSSHQASAAQHRGGHSCSPSVTPLLASTWLGSRCPWRYDNESIIFVLI